METVHIHLIVSHLPIFTLITGILVLGYALIRKSEYLDPLAMILFIISGLAAVVAYQTGEPAEHAVEGLAGVSHSLIESHEEIAEWAMISTGLLGLLAIAAWAIRNYWHSYRSVLMIGMLLLALIPGVLVGITANRGGKIRHTEIRSSVENASTDQVQGEAEIEEHED